MLHYNLSERYSFLLRTGNKTSMASTPPWLAAAAARLLDDAALSSESSSPSPPSGLRARGQSITGASRFQYLDQHSPRLSPRPWHCPRPEDHQRVLRFMDGGQRWPVRAHLVLCVHIDCVRRGELTQRFGGYRFGKHAKISPCHQTPLATAASSREQQRRESARSPSTFRDPTAIPKSAHHMTDCAYVRCCM